MSSEYYDDPVAAYDRLAQAYSEFSRRRAAYLRGVERQIITRIPGGAQSLLDIGAGDGTRAMRIADASGIARVVLVEPSAAMAALATNSAELWRIRAEELKPNAISERFDVVTCLWNTFGHVRGIDGRARVLRAAAELLSTKGRLFVDVNHRYNAGSYGWGATCARRLRDAVLHDSRTGDVTPTWNLGDSHVSTYGHVFTHREMLSLARTAELDIEERVVIDYGDGSRRRWSWMGNLLYIFRRDSRMDSLSAAATS